MATKAPRIAEAQRAERMGNALAARTMYRQILAANPADVEALRSLGRLALKEGHGADAVEMLQRAAQINPGDAKALEDLAVAMASVGRGPEGLGVLARAVQIDPFNEKRQLLLGRALLSAFQPDAAVRSLEGGLALFPRSAELHAELGAACLSLGLADRAAEQLSRAASLKATPESLTNLGVALRLLGRTDDAIAAFDRALAMSPGLEAALSGKAETFEMTRRYDEALAICDERLSKGSSNAAIVSLFARLSRRAGRVGEAVTVVRARLDAPGAAGLSPRARAGYHFALGSLLEEQGQIDEAFRAYAQARALYPKTFDEIAYAQAIGQFISIFSAERMKSLPRASTRSELPVLIVGMPRSGTTLVEQILGAHRDVFAAGELNDLNMLALQIPALLGLKIEFPACVEHLTAPAVDAVAARYLQRLRTLAASQGRGSVARVIDKMPHNFMLLGLAALVIPGAKVIHCRRDPMDNCFSCFATELNPIHAYASDLRSIGAAYRQYERIMRHWSALPDMPAVHEVVYEDLVRDPEATARRLVEFCGLPWDESCLRFNESSRPARTASMEQVRQPISDRSVGRAGKFSSHLAPLREALAGLA